MLNVPFISQTYSIGKMLTGNRRHPWLNALCTRETGQTADNNRVSAPPSAALRFATVLGPGTLSKRLIAFAFLLRADARRFGI
jgi:hypothetical protein